MGGKRRKGNHCEPSKHEGPSGARSGKRSCNIVGQSREESASPRMRMNHRSPAESITIGMLINYRQRSAPRTSPFRYVKSASSVMCVTYCSQSPPPGSTPWGTKSHRVLCVAFVPTRCGAIDIELRNRKVVSGGKSSALGLQRMLGLKSYETAWTWLRKFRRAMIRPGRDLLSGRVEVEECYIGAPEEGMQGAALTS